MKAMTFVTVGQSGTINGTVSSGDPANYPVNVPGISFVANDAAVLSAWNSIQAAGTFDDGYGNLVIVSQATYWQDVILNANGGFDGGNIVVTSNNPYYAPTGNTDTGSFDFSGDVTAGGNLSVTGNGAIGGTFTSTGAATLGSTLAVTGNVAVATNKFNVTASNGNTAIAGTLAVTGATTFTGAVTQTALPVYSVANALTAHAGGGQGSATALTKSINRITTVVTAADSVKLPAAVAGNVVTVINAAASNAADCFPASGDAINALSANTALSIAANKAVTFYCAVTGTWNSEVTA